MNVVLAKTPVNSGQKDRFSYVVSSGIYLLAALCKQHGFPVQIAEPSRWPEDDDSQEGLLRWIGQDADVVGFSAHTFNWATTLIAVNHLKRIAPDKIVVVGGIHPTHRPEQVMHSCAADYVIQGEAERAFPALLMACASGSDPSAIPGLAFRHQDRIVINDPEPPIDLAASPPPVPAYDLMPPETYQAITAETSRGCFFRCTFCSIPTRHVWRPLDAGDAVEMIARSVAVAGDSPMTDTVFLADDCFTTDRERAKTVCRQIVERKIPARLAFEARANDLHDAELVACIKAANPKLVQVGVECGYDRGLAMVGKKTTVDRVKRCAATLAAAGLGPDTEFSFIIGLPWEDEQDCLATMRFAATLVEQHDSLVNVAWWVPLPSKLWGERERYGIALDESFWDSPGWTEDGYWFADAHPRLTPGARLRIDERFEAYRAMGINLRVS